MKSIRLLECLSGYTKTGRVKGGGWKRPFSALKPSLVLLALPLLLFAPPLYAQSLDDYFQLASENNPGLQAKYISFEASMQRVAQVSSLPDPNLSFGAFISSVETRVGPQRAKVSLKQMFPWFGTLKAQGQEAKLRAEAKYQEFLDARNKLYYQVAAAYYPLYELQRLISIEDENQRILSSYKDIVTAKFRNGKGAMVDALRVDIRLKDSQTNLSILIQKRKPLAATFNKLLNRAGDEPIQVADTLQISPLPIGYRKDSLQTGNPLIDQLDLRIKASKAQEEVAIKQGLPKLGVGLDYAITAPRADMDLSDNGKNALMPMVSVSIPIYREKYRAAEKEAQLMQQYYAKQKEAVANQLYSYYERAWFETQKQQELIDLYEQQIGTSRQSLSLLLASYGNSGEAFEEVLRMQQQLLKYQKLKVSAVASYHTALAELNYITAKNY